MNSETLFALLFGAFLIFLLSSAAFFVYADHIECMTAIDAGVEFAKAVCN